MHQGLQGYRPLESIATRIERFVRDKGPYDTWVVAYSGGKDSTLLLLASLLAYSRLGSSLRPSRIVVIHNDTLAELPLMHLWASAVLYSLRYAADAIGVDIEPAYTTPAEVSTAYWRIAVRGYPMPTFRFRWCTNLLKVEPFKLKLSGYVGDAHQVLLLTGVRREESKLRAARAKRSTSAGEPIGVLDYNDLVKFAPLLDLREEDVWSILLNKGTISFATALGLPSPNLLSLVYCTRCTRNVRFGCWFCTVAKLQRAYKTFDCLKDRKCLLHFGVTLDGDIEFTMRLAILTRRLLRLLSDNDMFRIEKQKGYSSKGPLSIEARAIALALMYSMVSSDLTSRLLTITMYVHEHTLRTNFAYGLLEQGLLTGQPLIRLLLHEKPLLVEELAKKAGLVKRLPRKKLEEYQLVLDVYRVIRDEVISDIEKLASTDDIVYGEDVDEKYVPLLISILESYVKLARA